jgi:hypothetical protein
VQKLSGDDYQVAQHLDPPGIASHHSTWLSFPGSGLHRHQAVYAAGDGATLAAVHRPTCGASLGAGWFVIVEVEPHLA